MGKKFLTSKNLLAGLIILFSLLAFLAKTYPYFSFDLAVTKNIQQINYFWFNNLMVFISFLGNIWPGMISVGLVLFIFIILKKKYDALFLFISSIGAGLISESLKTLVARSRPDPSLIIQFGKYIRNDSFPSGHVLFFIGFYGFLLFLAFFKLKQGYLRSLLIFIISSLILLVGVSRIYLGAHWFSDVLGAYLIGTVWIFVVVLLYRKYLNAPGK